MTTTDEATTQQLIEALLDDPDFLDTFRLALRSRPQRPYFNMAGELIGVNPLAATGRVQVSPGQTISSASWGNPVWDQSVNCFASPTDRDSQWPSPHDGSVCYTADLGFLWVRRAGVWRGLPTGVLAQASSVANSPSTTTNVTWFSAPAVSTDGVRRLKISYTAFLNAGTANDVVNVRLMDGATGLQITQARLAVAGGTGQQSVASFWEGVPAVGSHTYSLQVVLAGGTGPAIGAASASNPAFLLVEDIGT
jgi:hypothetical protein